MITCPLNTFMNTLYEKNDKFVASYRLLFFFIIFSALPSFAQLAPGVEWQKVWTGGVGNSIIQTRDGGYMIAGCTNDKNAVGFHPSLDTSNLLPDMLIAKVDVSGAVEWQKCLGGSGKDIAQSIIQTFDGGYAIAGYTSSNDGDVTGNKSGVGGDAGWVVKLDFSGNIQWTKCFGETDLSSNPPVSYTYGFSIIQNTKGEYVVTGHEVYFANEGCYHGTADAFILKLDSSGKEVWQKCYGGNSSDESYSIIQTVDGGYCFAGRTNSHDGIISGYHVDSTSLSFPPEDAWVVKVNSSGNFVWGKCFGGIKNDAAGSVVQTADSGFVIAGTTSSNSADVSGNHGQSDAWVVKLNSSGNIDWQKCLGGKFADGAWSITKTSDGGFAVIGTTSSNDGDVSGYHPYPDSTKGKTRDIWVVKLDSKGTMQWQKCLGGSGNESGWSIIETTDGGYAIAGSTASIDGDLVGNQGKKGIWLVKLKAPTNTVESSFSASNSLLYQPFKIFPNPSSEEVHLQMRGEQQIKMVVFYDIMGRELRLPYELQGKDAIVSVREVPPCVYICAVTFTYNNYTGTLRLPLVVQH